MGKRLFFSAWLWFALLSLGSDPVQAYIADSRWTRTATNTSTGTMGTPATVTWSFPADGTTIPGNTTGTTTPSNLLNFLDTNWGVGPGGSDLTQRPWFPIFAQSFARLDALSGVTFVYESHDDGVAFSNTNSSRGVIGVRGDVRLGGRSYGSGSNTLASNYYPNYGDMMINTDQLGYFHNASNDYRGFRNTLMHEEMHGMGISHVDSSSSGFLIEPILSTAFDGPQLDDLLAIQRLYGDASEEGGGNDVFSTATQLGEISPSQSALRGTALSGTTILANQIDFLSIDDDSDTDFFKFSVSSRLDVSLQLAPQGTTYQVGPEGGTQSDLNSLALSDLSLALLGSNGTTILDNANLNPAGAGEAIARQLLPGTYYARVKGLADNIQLYQFGITATLPGANNLVWVGNVSQNWNVGTTANFSNSSASSAFYDGDHVIFNDTSSVKTVQLSSNVAPADVRINTASSYVFTGPGGIVTGNLLVEGPGIVELGNSGNSYAGSTQVLAGTLAITGNANAMQSAITIAAGATLRMDAADAATMTSTFTINSGGTLQIGIITSSTNVFPDLPTAVVDEGTIRVLTNESLRSVSGAGRIDVEHGTTTLAANPAFVGTLAVKSGAVAHVADASGIGSATTNIVVEGGGVLQLVDEGMFTQAFQLNADATLELAGANEFQESARISGAGLIVGGLAMPGTISPANAPGQSGSLSVADDLTLFATSLLKFGLGGATAGVDFASLDVDGSALLAGTLEVSFVDDFAPSLNDTFELLTTAGTLSGLFEAVDLPVLDASLKWDVVYEDHSVLLQVASAVTVLPGDFNLDGTVDAADYTVWRDGLDVAYTVADYDVWKSHFGETAGGGSAGNVASNMAVPEPYSLALSALAIGSLMLPDRSVRMLLSRS